MIPFLALVRKDLKLFFSDRKAVVIGLLVPIVCGTFLGYLFGGQGGNAEMSKVPCWWLTRTAATFRGG
jgi:hypothetical protein